MSEIQTYTPSNGAMLVCSSGGDYIKTKDHLATIARLEAEIADLRAEVEQLKKELRILYSSNADMFARAEQAEKELAAEREKSKCNHEWKEWTSTAGRTRQCIKCGQQYSWFG